MPFPVRRIAICTVFAALAAASAAMGADLFLHVPSRAFIVSVAPMDQESRDADNSVLYQRSARDDAWENIGPCDKVALPGGDVRFTREVNVDKDGRYEYTSRPVVAGEVVAPPDDDSPPQAVVVVDTLAPMAKILSPSDGQAALPGNTLDLVWEASDENLAEDAASLHYTTDGGRSWVGIADGLPRQGEMSWRAPDDMAGPALIRLVAVDRAGNLGRDVRRVDVVAATAPLPAPQQPEPPATVVRDDGAPEPDAEELARHGDPNRSWLYYLMAINLMRQNKPADALQYYWLSVKEDPDFIDAWADIALAYIDLGAYRTAREVLAQTREKAPERVNLMHLTGETYHAEGMAKLETARSAEERLLAKGLIDQAVEWYGRAIGKAAEDWRLAEQAPSFYRLGEVCYYVNMDRDGARAYWKKILDLHTPTPNLDLVLWTPARERDKARRQHQRYTSMRVFLDTWQNWARGYIEQLDARERAGIRDLMPARRISAADACAPSLAYAGNPLNPGRDDGRSLFSLPGELGSPAPVAACSATAGGMPTVEMTMPPFSHAGTAASGYSFYAKDEPARPREIPAGGGRRGGRSAFTGGPDRPPPPDPDPYSFPQGGRPRPAWSGAGPYGDQPVRHW